MTCCTVLTILLVIVTAPIATFLIGAALAVYDDTKRHN